MAQCYDLKKYKQLKMGIPKIEKNQEIKLYTPYSYEQILNLNKIKYRNLKIEILLSYLQQALTNLEECAERYKELINRTEFWERKSTFDFNFKDWNTIKKVNGKIIRYYNDLKKIEKKIKEVKNANQT